MPIRITSKKQGFRRCNIAHSDKPVIYPDDRFTKKELEILKAEPMLIVEKISLEEAKKAGWKPPEENKNNTQK